MKYEVISTGTEIMNGTIVDTNSSYIMKRLYELGVKTFKNVSISDDRDTMFDIIKNSIETSDVIFIIGGLGPTEDDHTKDIVAEVLNKKLILDEDILNGLKERYNSRGVIMPSNNTQQALLLEGSKALNNKFGTAPGVYIEHKDKKIFLYPGPPRELIPMFEDSIKYLDINDLENEIFTINTCGIGESNLEMILKDIDKPKEIEVLTYAKDRRVDIQLLYNKKIDRNLINNYKDLLTKELDSNIYGYNYKTMEEMFLNKCLDKNIKVSLAESCTGGLLANRLTNIEGSSKVLNRSIVTYSNISKIEELGVEEDTLNKYGAISEQTAKEMAMGVLKKSNTDLAISITGVAGPGKEEGKKEGLVYIGVATNDQVTVKEHMFSGDRKVIKSLAASQAFIDAIKIIEK